MKNIKADIKFLVFITICVTTDGEDCEEVTYEKGDEEKKVIIIEETGDMVTLQYRNGSFGTVDRKSFEITCEY